MQDHWNNSSTLQTIRQGKWNYVILQEQSQTPIFNQSQFRESARQLDGVINSSGAESILLMTWERPDSVAQGVTATNLANAYTLVGNTLKIRVAPAGLAFAHSLRARPELQLYSQDGHPTMYGTYLAACVLYGTLFSKPVGNPYADWSIAPEIKSYFQQIATDSLGF